MSRYPGHVEPQLDLAGSSPLTSPSIVLWYRTGDVQVVSKSLPGGVFQQRSQSQWTRGKEGIGKAMRTDLATIGGFFEIESPDCVFFF